MFFAVLICLVSICHLCLSPSLITKHLQRNRSSDHLERILRFREGGKEGMQELMKEFSLFQKEFQTNLPEMTKKVSFLEEKNKEIEETVIILQPQLCQDEKELLYLRSYTTLDLEKTQHENEHQLIQMENETAQLKKQVHDPENCVTSVAETKNTLDSRRKFNIRIPKFGKNDNNRRPMKFIHNLKRYVDFMDPNKIELKCIISEALEGAASHWFNLYENRISTFHDFQEKLEKYFWNENTHHAAKRKLEFGYFNIRGRLDKSRLCNQSIQFGKRSVW